MDALDQSRVRFGNILPTGNGLLLVFLFKGGLFGRDCFAQVTKRIPEEKSAFAWIRSTLTSSLEMSESTQIGLGP